MTRSTDCFPAIPQSERKINQFRDELVGAIRLTLDMDEPIFIKRKLDSLRSELNSFMTADGCACPEKQMATFRMYLLAIEECIL